MIWMTAKMIKAGTIAGWSLALFFAPEAQAHSFNLPAAFAEPGTPVEDVHIGLSYSEGPAVDPARIWKITPAGVKSVYKDPSRGSNGLEFDNQGRLHIGMMDSVLRVETDGKVTPLASTGGNFRLGRINDLSVSSTGAVFFTNLGGGNLFFRNTAGQITNQSLGSINGVEWIEEKSLTKREMGLFPRHGRVA